MTMFGPPLGDKKTIVKTDVLELDTNVRIKKDPDNAAGIRIYSYGDDTVGSVLCSNLYTYNIYLGPHTDTSIYDSFLYWPENDDEIITSSIPCFTPGTNEIRDSEFPTNTTLWATTINDPSSQVSNVVSTIEIGNGPSGENTRKISFTYTNGQYYGGYVSNSQTFPEPSTNWLQGIKSIYVRITNAETLTGLTIFINGEPYGTGFADTDVSGWTLNAWNIIYIDTPIYPYQGYPFERVDIGLSVPANSPTGTYAFEISYPKSLTSPSKMWIEKDQFATTGDIPTNYTTYHGSSETVPATYAPGDEYYNTGDSKFYKYNGTDWMALN